MLEFAILQHPVRSAAYEEVRDPVLLIISIPFAKLGKNGNGLFDLFCRPAQLRGMAEEMKGHVVGGEGKIAELDGGYFGGYVSRPTLRPTARALGTKTGSGRLSS
ncbi:hypothetical protein JQ615_31095 [Bradyrhizobium jicamae]|uniref:Uncharacterized protein n=1 Tax=Bradyrhizobium jicamae TaxID=280332 RepID=A0ABS5FSW2_9BRAD|nr:hypothetical protein [Bradyrhizobium jicamae]MBR0799825.1 hypothetical protein [Bradyrhizobium jicamae]